MRPDASPNSAHGLSGGLPASSAVASFGNRWRCFFVLLLSFNHSTDCLLKMQTYPRYLYVEIFSSFQYRARSENLSPTNDYPLVLRLQKSPGTSWTRQTRLVWRDQCCQSWITATRSRTFLLQPPQLVLPCTSNVKMLPRRPDWTVWYACCVPSFES